MDDRSAPAITRRDLLKLGTTAVAGAGALDLARPGASIAQTPKRGGTFRIATLLDPVGWDPHQTISFATMTLLSFVHSRLMKVKAGPSVKPGTYPAEGDLAESWTQPHHTTPASRLRKRRRWPNNAPVDGRRVPGGGS